MRRAILCFATVIIAGATSAGAAGSSPPRGATARCRDGTYSYSQHRSGTCSGHGGVSVWLKPTSSEPAAPAKTTPSQSSLVLGHTVVINPRTRAAGCRAGPEPDRRCSPGGYYSDLTQTVICSPTFRTSSVRNVPQTEKFAVEREYSMKPAYYGRSIEIDHIISLELGGSNDIANLFPEPGSGPADYHVKDRLENRLHSLVCAGRMDLRAAQRAIARDWEMLYRRIFGAAPTS